MSKFKVGDRVRCIDAYSDPMVYPYIRVGEFYTISVVDGIHINLKEFPKGGGMTIQQRFELAYPTPPLLPLEDLPKEKPKIIYRIPRLVKID